MHILLFLPVPNLRLCIFRTMHILVVGSVFKSERGRVYSPVKKFISSGIKAPHFLRSHALCMPTSQRTTMANTINLVNSGSRKT